MSKIFVTILFILSIYTYSSSRQTNLKSELETNIATIAKDMSEELSLKKNISFLVMQKDNNYLINVESLYDILQKELKKDHRKVKFNPFNPKEKSIIRSIISKQNDGYAQLNLSDIKLDSMILNIDIFIANDKSISAIIKVINHTAELLYKSSEFSIKLKDAGIGLKRELFNKLDNKLEFEQILYKGKVLKKMEELFATDNLGIYSVAEYEFGNNWSYAIKWQVSAIKEILSLKYGFIFQNGSHNKIIISKDGSIIFNVNGKEKNISAMVDVDPLIDDDFPEEQDQYHYLYKKKVITKKFKTNREQGIQKYIINIIQDSLSLAYNNFDTKFLNRIFTSSKNDKNIILKGKIVESNSRTGKERVAYKWVTKKEYIDNLKKLYNRGYTFDVTLTMIGVFKDTKNPNRYWAIVKQGWKTKNGLNTVYKDDGFLFINFDFLSGSASDSDIIAKKFEIRYRLWFYNYKYDIKELGINRYDKLKNDIDHIFLKGMSGIDYRLKNNMMDFLIDKAKNNQNIIK